MGRKVRDRVDDVIDESTELVVAHSLGARVSYLVLADRPDLSPALIAIDPPLATPMVFARLRPSPVDGVARQRVQMT